MATVPEAKPETGADRERQVQTLFSEIAPRYDLLNHVLSLNIDKRWRKTAVDRLGWEEAPDGLYLDACAGTFDLGLEITGRKAFQGQVIASDFARPMLVEGLPKIEKSPVAPVCGDTLQLPFPDATFNGAVVGFGVRNLSDLSTGFGEFHRVLAPGGRLVVLEFTVPPNPLMRWGYMLYFNRLLPVIGRIVSGHPWAYTYLPESVKEFPGAEELADLMRGAGFARVDWSLLTGGIAALHVAQKG